MFDVVEQLKLNGMQLNGLSKAALSQLRNMCSLCIKFKKRDFKIRLNRNDMYSTSCDYNQNNNITSVLTGSGLCLKKQIKRPSCLRETVANASAIRFYKKRE